MGLEAAAAHVENSLPSPEVARCVSSVCRNKPWRRLLSKANFIAMYRKFAITFKSPSV